MLNSSVSNSDKTDIAAAAAGLAGATGNEATAGGSAADMMGNVMGSETLDELRADLSVILADVQKVVELRATQMKDAALEGVQSGYKAATDTVETYPWASVGGAALLGFAIAVMIAPRSTRRSKRDWQFNDIVPQARHMVGGMIDQAVPSRSSVLSAFERVMESVSTIDPKSSLKPTIDKAASWISAVRDSLGIK